MMNVAKLFGFLRTEIITCNIVSACCFLRVLVFK